MGLGKPLHFGGSWWSKIWPFVGLRLQTVATTFTAAAFTATALAAATVATTATAVAPVAPERSEAREASTTVPGRRRGPVGPATSRGAWGPEALGR